MRIKNKFLVMESTKLTKAIILSRLSDKANMHVLLHDNIVLSENIYSENQDSVYLIILVHNFVIKYLVIKSPNAVGGSILSAWQDLLMQFTYFWVGRPRVSEFLNP